MRNVLPSLVVASACVAVLAAQSPSPITPPTPSPTTPQASTNQQPAKPATITIEGCVERNAITASPSATAGAVGTSGTVAGAFILSDAMRVAGTPGSASGAGVAGTSGVSGAGASGAPAMRSTYRLDAEDSQLSPHVGHKVEITGTLDELTGRSTGSANATGASNVAAAPKLKVESVRMIASTCTAAQ